MEGFIDYGGVQQRIADFDKRHGSSIHHEGWILFQDGAYRESNPMGLMAEPPANRADRARARCHYFKIIYDRAVKAFDQMKLDYKRLVTTNLNSPVCGPPPNPARLKAELTALKTAALAAKAAYDNALAEAEGLKPGTDRNAAQAELLKQELNRAALEALEKIEL